MSVLKEFIDYRIKVESLFTDDKNIKINMEVLLDMITEMVALPQEEMDQMSYEQLDFMLGWTIAIREEVATYFKLNR